MSGAETVSSLLDKVAEKYPGEISANSSRVIFSGRVMANDKALSAYGIKSDNTVFIRNSAASNQQSDPASCVNTTASAPISANEDMINQPFANLMGNIDGSPSGPLTDFMRSLGIEPPPSFTVSELFVSGHHNYPQHERTALEDPDFVNNMISKYFGLPEVHEGRDVLHLLTEACLRKPDIIDKMMYEVRVPFDRKAEAFPTPGITDTTPVNVVSGGSSQVQQEQNISQPDLMGIQEGNGGCHDVMGYIRELEMLQFQAMLEQVYTGRYANELGRLNDAGFCDFEQNIEALNQADGSVGDAIEYLTNKKLDNVPDRS
ncbi:Deubiquitination-protection dph1 [Fusarium coicis]|nr:Deubiquitination-protection dph1 [Fusarium coicis]